MWHSTSDIPFSFILKNYITRHSCSSAKHLLAIRCNSHRKTLMMCFSPLQAQFSLRVKSNWHTLLIWTLVVFHSALVSGVTSCSRIMLYTRPTWVMSHRASPFKCEMMVEDHNQALGVNKCLSNQCSCFMGAFLEILATFDLLFCPWLWQYHSSSKSTLALFSLLGTSNSVSVTPRKRFRESIVQHQRRNATFR